MQDSYTFLRCSSEISAHQEIDISFFFSPCTTNSGPYYSFCTHSAPPPPQSNTPRQQNCSASLTTPTAPPAPSRPHDGHIQRDSATAIRLLRPEHLLWHHFPYVLHRTKLAITPRPCTLHRYIPSCVAY